MKLGHLNSLATIFQANGIFVYKFYYPNARWSDVKAKANNCSFFIYTGIVDEESLKAYARIHITTHLMDKGHPQYDYFKSIIAEEPDAIDHFYSNFYERIKNGLRQAGVASREELIELVRQTGLVGVHQIGKK